ncbi:ATP-binding cassette domain-containing protein, partial [Bacillus pumilus]|uniref:ATP-binding cassette domain-containing protein n=1 Tax=Bacillus pumilus TaxID=1408 RepID=UPI0034D9736F
MDWVGGLFDLEKKIIGWKREEVLKLWRVYEGKDRGIGRYSGGMKERVGIGQGVMNSGKILIVDES